MTPEEWERFDTKRPRISVSGLSSALALHFGLRGDLVLLAAEREQVFSLTVKDGTTLIVRASAIDAMADSAHAQVDALEAVAAADPSLPVPRVRRSRRGVAIERIRERENEYQIRVLSCLPGRPLAAPWSDAVLHQIGSMVARLDSALATCGPCKTGFPLLWNLLDAHEIRPLARFIRDTRLRAMVERVLDDFEAVALPRLRDLPAQLIHNDISPKNLLFHGGDPIEVSGIIDFGDVVHSPRIVDLGIAIARFASPNAPLTSVAPLVLGFSEVLPLDALEVRLLPCIVRTRLAMRVAIWSWRLQHSERDGISPLRDASDLLCSLSEHGSTSLLRAASEQRGSQ